MPKALDMIEQFPTSLTEKDAITSIAISLKRQADASERIATVLEGLRDDLASESISQEARDQLEKLSSTRFEIGRL